MKQFRAKLTYANIVSSICLFLLLGGGAAFAATKLAKNSVGTKQLKNGAVTQPKVNPALLAELKGATGPAGPQGSQGKDGSADTPAQVLGKLTQVDGAGSGLDADRLDGVDSPRIAKVVGDLTLENFNFGKIAPGRCGQISTGGLEGAMPGDFVLATPTNGDTLPGGFTLTGSGVEAASNGEARLCNHTAVEIEPIFDIRMVAIRF
jgi:hypothetical protein